MAEAREFLEEDQLFSTPQRLTIMLLLYLHKKAGFTELRKLLQLTPGNLDHHIRKLKDAGYVKTRYVVVNRPLSVIEITREGAEAFKNYAVKLRALLDSVTSNGQEKNWHWKI
ncbi:MAG: transcriptional regulator [Promethearchaeota archaeon]